MGEIMNGEFTLIHKEKRLLIYVNKNNGLIDLVPNLSEILKPDIGGNGVFVNSHDYPEGEFSEYTEYFPDDISLLYSGCMYEVKFLIPIRYYNKHKLLGEESIFKKVYCGTRVVLVRNRNRNYDYKMVWMP